MAKSSNKLLQIPPDEISPNPENPRLIFRQEEMDSLLRSIDQHGIQVPLTVYIDSGRYYLLDGERRWRCAKKLNLSSVPAIVQAKPSELQNLILMYNIHALREQWDYFTIASKLERVINLFRDENGYEPNERVLSELTGLTIGAIRRCQALLGLPDRFKDMLLEELEKPKIQQRITEDFFIEMEKALKAVVRRIPKYEERLDDIRNVLVSKFRAKTISAVTDFRQLSKIATAVENLGVAQQQAEKAIDKVFDPNKKFGIQDAYRQAVEFEYVERRIERGASSLADILQEIIEEERTDELNEEVLADLRSLLAVLQLILE